jgi:VanZ family protein
LIAFLLLIPSTSELSAPDWLDRFAAAGGDKLIHGLLFLVQAALLERTWRRRLDGAWGVWLAVLVALLYGLALESLQEMVPGRGWEWDDLVADGLGAAAWPLLMALRRP